MASFKPPNAFNPGPFPAEEWEKWRQRFELYSEASDITSKPISQQRAILLHTIGDEGFELYNILEIPEQGDARTVKVILDAVTAHYNPYRNTTYKRYVFFSITQLEAQSIDSYVLELKTKAKECEFGALTDSLVRDRIICGIKDHNLRERLLREPNLTLNAAIDICRADEVTKQQVNKMEKTGQDNNLVGAISKVSMRNRPAKGKNLGFSFKKHAQEGERYTDSSSQKDKKYSCKKCLKVHLPKSCPAYGQKCYKCSKMNHFAVACKFKPMHSINTEEHEDDDDNLFLGSLFQEVHQGTQEWYENVQVLNHELRFKIDTGSQVNVLPLKVFRMLDQPPTIECTSKVITAYSGHSLDVKGTCHLTCTYNDVKTKCEFFVVDTYKNAPAILGLQTSETLGILKRVSELATQESKFGGVKLMNNYPELFKGVGHLPGKHKIVLQDGAIPKVHAARKIPIGLQDKVKTEIARMEELGIITRVEEPTDWVHPIVIVPKPTGEVRICMDPRDLNEAIKREHYRIPTSEEIFCQLQGATHFTVLDAASAFWQIELDYESSKLCTIATPYGRFRFNRLPYGIKSAPEVYQKAMDQAMEGLDGVASYFDDVLVWGTGIANHDERLEKALNRAQQINLKLKKEKIRVAVQEIDYLGHKITTDGIKADPQKVEAILKLSSPTSKTELQQFLGMINYLTKFIPNLSSRETYLRSLLRKNVSWLWDSQAQQEFENLKQTISSTPVLKFFDPKKPSVISVDASQFGLGAVLMQDNLPVAYASATLNDTQRRYAQIEKELLGVVFGCEHFHFYVYGRSTTVQTDHKPLLAIVKKPLESLSPRLQRLVLRLQRYQLTLQYIPGKELLLADALSRNPMQDSVFNSTYLDVEIKEINAIKVKMTNSRQAELIAATKSDEELQSVIRFIKNGWPKRLSSVPKDAHPYWKLRAELHEEGGFLFKEDKLVIPKSERQRVLEQVHQAHQGIVACKSKARQCIYWPGMSKAIEERVLQCEICQATSRANQKEPLLPHPIPSRPWERIGMDFMKLKDTNYMLVVDYFSKYIEVQPLSSLKAEPVCQALKSICARHGIPNELVTDNGPPFDSVVFKLFLTSWNIEHITSSPYLPKSNGMVERNVQTAKNVLRKAIAANEDPYLALLELRSTPLGDLPSAAEMLMGRKLRTLLPCTSAYLKPKFDIEAVKKTLHKRQDQQKSYADVGAKPMEKLYQQQPVWMQSKHRTWVPAKVVRVEPEPRSYQVVTPTGSTFRRNRIHLRPVNLAVGDHKDTRQSDVVSPTKGQSSVPEREFNASDSFTDQEELKVPSTTQPVYGSPAKKTKCGRVVKTPIRFKD